MREYAPLIVLIIFGLLIGLASLILHLLFERKKKAAQPPVLSVATPECPNFESKALSHEDSWESLMREKIRKHAKIITVRENKKLIDIDTMERAIREAAKEYVQSLSEDPNDKSA